MSTRSAPPSPRSRLRRRLFRRVARLSLDQRGLYVARSRPLCRLVVVARGGLSGGDRLQRLGHFQRHRRAILIADLIDGRDNPWLQLFDATRIKPVAGAREFVAGTAGTASALIGGYLAKKPHSFDALAPGEAAILKLDGKNVAGFRDDSGNLHAVSAVCTHLGCLVGWNETDRSWDCPCHGSRFALDGEVIHGPAVKALARIGVKEPV